VLDIASGSGYGTKVIAETAKKVYGVDVDEPSINYAREHYGGKNIEYLVGDGESIPLPDDSVDVVVTFETIEHIKDYKRFIKEIDRVLRPDGLAIVSTPNDLEFAEGNHFHLHEFQYEELVGLLRQDFKFIDSYYQTTWKYVAVGDEAFMQAKSIVDAKTLNMCPTPRDQYLYFYLLCSNRKITEKITPLAALGEHYSDRQLTAERAQASETIKKQKGKINLLSENLKEANEQALRMQKERDDLRIEINRITATRSYILARKISRLKGGSSKHGKK
jgi:ubiquinone/menaquinone biosynthesis C-methylase UbiE